VYQIKRSKQTTKDVIIIIRANIIESMNNAIRQRHLHVAEKWYPADPHLWTPPRTCVRTRLGHKHKFGPRSL